MKKLNFDKKTVIRFLGIFVLIVSLPVFVYLAQMAVKYFSKADIPPVNLYVLPSDQNIPPEGSFKVTADFLSYSVSFIRASIIFDNTKVNITEILPDNSRNFYVVYSTPLDEANSKGLATVALAVPPSEDLLTGLVDIFSFKIDSITSEVVSTQILVDTSDSQVVFSQGGTLLIAGNNSRINLNSITSTSTPTPTQILILTPTPTESLSEVSPTISIIQCSDAGGLCKDRCIKNEKKIVGYCETGVCCK